MLELDGSSSIDLWHISKPQVGAVNFGQRRVNANGCLKKDMAAQNVLKSEHLWMIDPPNAALSNATRTQGM